VDKSREPEGIAYDMAGFEGGQATPLPASSAAPPQPTASSEPDQVVEELSGNWAYVSASAAMREVLDQVRLVARIDVPVLLLGESGTGKEVIARLIHKHSQRSQRTFMKVNCTALPVELLESELFGFEAGAFTGARQAKPGKFEICHKGTILLDEIAEMPIPPQAKLLHVLQDGEFSRLGSPTPTRVDVRVLAATNVDVMQAIEARRLRADLYYRLNAFTIHLPPLRARKADIPIMLEHFIASWADRFGRPHLPVSDKMLKACMDYSWPGNVRELENLVKYYLVLGDEDRVLTKLGTQSNGRALHFESMQQAMPSECSDLKSMVRGLKQGAEKEVILHALQQTRGSRKEAAAMLKISLRALQYKIREYNIEQMEHPSEPRAA
jgi:two-component system, NtrC family, response regulator AtoC